MTPNDSPEISFPKLPPKFDNSKQSKNLRIQNNQSETYCIHKSVNKSQIMLKNNWDVLGSNGQ
eukprot:TRINITY_DN3612_c0_g1_i1.p2 TRINITY_DN3612_c0_g1~~TRINITY_DN3612_c0_g1_i1.p2  ORF type:complete len:63 (-),score=9.04 TRINITY_DN3612_c0_g1_i1:276-464(-)